MNLLGNFSIEQIKQESQERGWLFSVISGWCLLFGLLCLTLAAAVFVKSLFFDGVPTQSALGMTIAGTVITAATAMMWKRNALGRNVAIVSVACMSWVIGGYIARRTGHEMGPQVMTIVFAAMSVACFTGERGRALFRKESDEGDAGSNP